MENNNKSEKFSLNRISRGVLRLVIYEHLQENRIIEAVWQIHIRHISRSDCGNVFPRLLQSICNPYVHIAETDQHPCHSVSIYYPDQKGGNILLYQSWHQQERVSFHSLCCGIHRLHIVNNPYSIFR